MTDTPLVVNHVGITVPDIFAAIDWYAEIFGFTHIMGPRLLSVHDEATAETGQVLGHGFKTGLQAHLLSGNGVGFELFEPIDPRPQRSFEDVGYLRPGPWHVAVTCRDVQGMVDRILAAGGRPHTPPAFFVPGRPWQLSYVRDPWWMTLEIVSHSYAEMFANWPQPGAMTTPTFIDRAAAIRMRAESVQSANDQAPSVPSAV
jgi:catechol 2,3-dioxygenase-like lactoylglutathione lyase family enzyme